MDRKAADLKSLLPPESPICVWPASKGNGPDDEWEIGVALDCSGLGVPYDNQKQPPSYYANIAIVYGKKLAYAIAATLQVVQST